MFQNGLFDTEIRLAELSEAGDPLERLKQVVDWELFREDLSVIRHIERKSKAGRKPYDVVLMFKILILGTLYNLGDDSLEFQIRDRLTFMRFLGLSLGDRVPDAKTIWLFRDQLTHAGLAKPLFERFSAYLQSNGFRARKGQIVDASLVSVPVQRNTREENQQIKEGNPPQQWSDAKRCQKDTDARWTKKNQKSYFGYKNHICVDAKHKIIRDYVVTDASVHDSQVFDELLDDANTSRDVWADSAYRSKIHLQMLSERGFREHIQRKGKRNQPLSPREKQGNRTRSRIRSRVEHVFGIQAQIAGQTMIRAIGKARVAAMIGFRNLAYNLHRYSRVLQTS
ncbi:MAG: IS5 family transposase [Nitrospinaceae bacterium]|jgi:IS5 family transposase|nr:IS5 family transposase [Nitrospinaceae bacterium]MEE1551077.1 IS5 family transposase [Nitrospinaceae bacterium]